MFPSSVKCGSDIQGTLRINSNDFGNPPTFPVGPPAGQNVQLFGKTSQQLQKKSKGDEWFVESADSL